MSKTLGKYKGIKTAGLKKISLLLMIVVMALAGGCGGGNKKNVAEAQRIIASFESAFLAALAETDDPMLEKSSLNLELRDSEQWAYNIERGGMFTAKSKIQIGNVEPGATLITVYDIARRCFHHIIDPGLAAIAPNFAGGDCGSSPQEAMTAMAQKPNMSSPGSPPAATAAAPTATPAVICDTNNIIRIGTFDELNRIGKDSDFPLCGRYELTANINAAESKKLDGGRGFEPIGSGGPFSSSDMVSLLHTCRYYNLSDIGCRNGDRDAQKVAAHSFSGSLDGKGFMISGLYINRPDLDNVGLFGVIYGAKISNLGLVIESVTGNSHVGGLVGYGIFSSITKSYVSGNVVGRGESVGGMVGAMNINHVTDCHAAGTVTGNSGVGGLVGNNVGTISNCYSTARVKGSSGDIEGGLTTNSGYTFRNYWDIKTSGVNDSRNLDKDGSDPHIRGCDNPHDIDIVCELDKTAGSSAADNFDDEGCDMCKDGPAWSDGYYSVRGRTTAEMTMKITFEGWDFDKVWQIDAGKNYPRLRGIKYPASMKAPTDLALPEGMLQAAGTIDESMVPVSGGTFMMGCTEEQGNDCFSNEKPAKRVTVKDFQIGKFEVTRRQWNQIMYSNPPDISDGDLPVEGISQADAEIFISRLNAFTGKKYRLPTAAEWEYAARGGAKGEKYKYAGSDNAREVANHGNGRFIPAASCARQEWVNLGGSSNPVGSLAPNGLGLYDMSGNVWELVKDNGIRGGGYGASERYSRVSTICQGGLGGVGLRLALPQ